MRRCSAHQPVGRPVPVAKGQRPLFPLEDTAAQPLDSEEVEDPWGGARARSRDGSLPLTSH